MKFDTQTAAEFAGDKLDLLLERAKRDTNEIIQKNDVPSAVKHYAELDALVDTLVRKASALKKHVDSLSYEILPTMFGNHNVKTIKIDYVGRVTVNVRWSASMIDKQKSMEWLRTSGNEGLIQETVNAQTLGAFAKTETMAGKPLPDHLFRVSTAQHMSITKE
jgi:hypothetical protein